MNTKLTTITVPEASVGTIAGLIYSHLCWHWTRGDYGTSGHGWQYYDKADLVVPSSDWKEYLSLRATLKNINAEFFAKIQKVDQLENRGLV